MPKQRQRNHNRSLKKAGKKVGWTPPRRVYRIEPDSGPYEGLMVRVGSVPLGQFMDLASLAEQFEDYEDDGKTTGEMLGIFSEMKDMFNRLANSIIEWNIELPPIGRPNDPVEPIPSDISGLHRLDFGLAMWIFNEWVTAMSSLVDGPLGEKPPREANSQSGVSEATLADLSRSLLHEPS